MVLLISILNVIQEGTIYITNRQLWKGKTFWEDIDSEGKIALFKNIVESVNSRSQIAGITLLIKGIVLEFKYIGFKEEKEGE